MYYELEFCNGIWIAYDYYADNNDDSVICTHQDREACIARAEAMGYRWAGE